MVPLTAKEYCQVMPSQNLDLGGYIIFVFPKNCAWLPLFGFLPYTNASCALQPGLTQSRQPGCRQSLRSCREGRHPPTPPPGYQSALKSHCVSEWHNSQRCRWQPRLPKEGLVHNWHGRRWAAAIWALGRRLFQIHISSLLSQKRFKTAFQNTWWHVPK